MARVVVERSEPAAAGLSALLEARGDDVVVIDASLDAYLRLPWRPDVAYLDVWTPEVALQVEWLRSQGARLTCLAERVLADSPVPVIGVTGTAGKSTTAAILAATLAAGGVAVGGQALATGQWWAGDAHLALLAAGEEARAEVALLELTSSHLAFCESAPAVAVITNLWADHVELHGSFAAYVAAKRRILAHGDAPQTVVANADDDGALALVDGVPSDRLWWFSERRPVARGAYVADGLLRVRVARREVVWGEVGDLTPTMRAAVLAAVTACAAYGVAPETLRRTAAMPTTPVHRAQEVGRCGGAVLIDDSLAATTTKASATFARFTASSIIAVIGGELVVDGRTLQSSAEERRRQALALDVLARTARRVVAFGPAGEALQPALVDRGVLVEVFDHLDEAVARARRLLAAQVATSPVRALVVAPMFPVAADARERVPALLRGEI